uniref:Regulator of microtubule dynamics protein 1 n=1 Tax=Amphilophus citrinellus TaxID=61819 RepID=A0A3Q0R5V1_AMPCI
MAGRLLTRTLAQLASGANCAKSRAANRNYWTTLRSTPTALTAGRAAFLLGLPALPCFGYAAYRKVQSSAVVCALEKGEVLEQADYLYSCAETEKLYQLLLQYKDSDDAEFLWRLARASRDLALLPNVEAERKKQLTFEAFEYAQKALEKDEACFAAHKWYAVCLSDVGDYKGVKVKIGNSYIIREHLERAIELNPKDATSIHILVLFFSLFQALAFFLKAEEVDPNFYSKNLLMLGKTYLAMKDKEKALLWLTKAKEYPAHTLEDKEVHKEAVDLLKKLG